jgi:hypothetical protein
VLEKKAHAGGVEEKKHRRQEAEPAAGDRWTAAAAGETLALLALRGSESKITFHFRFSFSLSVS